MKGLKTVSPLPRLRRAQRWPSPSSRRGRLVLALWVGLAGACGVPHGPLPSLLTSTLPVPTVRATDRRPIRTPSPPTPTSSPAPTLPPPASFTTTALRSGVAAATYVDDACRALRLRWDPEGSPPGTVVAPIMFHSVRDPHDMLQDSVTISTDDLAAIAGRARALGFQTITSEELAGFLEANRRIPPRSMIWIVDDRRPGTVEKYLLPQAEANDWTITLGWIIADTRADLWAWMERLNATGRLDFQSHGYWHTYIVSDTPEETIRQEIVDPIPILQEHFGHRPIAFVWPGGNFTKPAVEVAREAGYRLGFTAFSRGPLLFNWIPLGAAETLVGDPVMVLPRFWSTAALVNLDQAAAIAEQAEAFARESYPVEAAWYHASCGGDLPSPPWSTEDGRPSIATPQNQ